MKNIIIIGAGLAGLSAAITCVEKGAKAILISSMPSERAQSAMAEGGINAALNTKGEDDSTHEHYLDTLSAGANLANPNAVYALAEAAPSIVRRLMKLGVMFNMSGNDEPELRNFGGQKKKRTVFSQSDTGKQIMTAIIQEARKYEASGQIERYNHHSFVNLIKSGGHCVGCVIQDDYSGEALSIAGSAVIIASGGMNGLFGMTTGSVDNTGAAIAELFLSGIPIANGEFIQYHPTTVIYSGKLLLISEAARSEGGRLFSYENGKPYYFMEEKYPQLGNLMPRDIVSREVFEREQVYLDMTGISNETFQTRLAGILEDCQKCLHIDPRKEPISVSAGIHYFMGGIYVDENHATILPGLFAAGECCCQYHGANRLGGNSLLGAIHGGMVAANTAVLFENDKKGRVDYSTNTAETLSNTDRLTLNRIMRRSLGVVRYEDEIKEGIVEINKLSGALPLLGKALLMSALSRRESRGAHYRLDFPEINDALFHKTTVAQYDGKDISIRFDEIPKRR